MTGRRIPVDAAVFLALPSLQTHPDLCAALSQDSSAFEFDAGVEVVGQESQGDDLFIILDGRVRVNMVASSGRQITYQILDQGEFFGELAAIDGGTRSAAVFAETDCRVAIVRQAQFQGLLNKYPDFARVLLERLVRLSRWLATRVFEYHAYDVRGRIYTELLREAQDHATAPNEIQMSDHDMASRVGTTRENVTRIYGELRKQNIIDRNNKHLKLLAPDRLQQLIDECVFN